MKKIVKLILLQFLIVFLMMSTVKAEELPCKISLSSSKTTLNPGDEITVSILMSNITVSDGIQYVNAILDYSTDVFEIVYDESDLAEDKLAQFEDEGDEGNVAMVYVGENDTTLSGNKWDVALLYDEDTESNGILAFSEEKQTQTQTIGKIKFKVKSDAPKIDTKISLEEVSVFSIDDDDDGMKVEDASVSFTVNGKEVAAASQPANNVNNVENRAENKVENKVKENTNNQDTSEKETPYTGIEDYFPVIAIVMLIAVISYFNYKKYKDIK